MIWNRFAITLARYCFSTWLENPQKATLQCSKRQKMVIPKARFAIAKAGWFSITSHFLIFSSVVAREYISREYSRGPRKGGVETSARCTRYTKGISTRSDQRSFAVRITIVVSLQRGFRRQRNRSSEKYQGWDRKIKSLHRVYHINLSSQWSWF